MKFAGATVLHGPHAARFLAEFLGSPCTHVTLERWLSDTFLEQEEFPCLADLVSLMLDALTQPARLPPLGEAGEEGGTHVVLWDIAVHVRLAVQDNDILMDEGAGTLSLQGQGEAFAIRGFQGDMCLKLGLVLLGDVNDAPELVRQPVGFEVIV